VEQNVSIKIVALLLRRHTGRVRPSPG